MRRGESIVLCFSRFAYRVISWPGGSIREGSNKTLIAFGSIRLIQIQFFFHSVNGLDVLIEKS